MDIGLIRGLGTLVVFVAFIGVVLWAYNSKRRSSFDEAAQLPFADDPQGMHNQQVSRSNQE
ncbi:MAG TPA: cbb3-type cytochrome c oxidase subunit 3 [Pseudomonas sp.]|nr:cbb3-type cytochrome c oxidase subunit 3 [Pseudomonas sp.]